jgi:aminoglycoside 3-N-acetyltransferase
LGPVNDDTAPATDRQLIGQLSALGLPPGRDVLVHCSLRQVGPVAGGAATLLAAIQAVIGPTATVVVPALTPDNSTTSPAFFHAVRGLNAAARASYVQAMPGFDPARTPSFRVGAFAEFVRSHPDSVRSSHPQTSFAALGPAAARLTARHDLDAHLGARSPLGALYRAGASVLLLGVGYDTCTAFHLAEYRQPRPPVRAYRCFTLVNGRRLQHDFRAVDLHDQDFAELGSAFELANAVARGAVGRATARVFDVRDAVDYAAGWMSEHRSS